MSSAGATSLHHRANAEPQLHLASTGETERDGEQRHLGCQARWRHSDVTLEVDMQHQWQGVISAAAGKQCMRVRLGPVRQSTLLSVPHCFGDGDATRHPKTKIQHDGLHPCSQIHSFHISFRHTTDCGVLHNNFWRQISFLSALLQV